MYLNLESACKKKENMFKGNNDWSHIHSGKAFTSAVTILINPKLDRAPLIRPQEKAIN